MAKKRSKNIRKLTKVGKYSYSIIIPAEIISKLRWRERQKVVVKRVGKRIIISDWPVKKRK